MNGIEPKFLVCIGLGGICEGWVKPVMDWHQTGIIPFSQILLVDGKTFSNQKRARQHFLLARNKAQERAIMWQRMYPDVPVRYSCQYVGRKNVQHLIPDGAIVLCSPDNHATRKLVSDHAQTLENILLIAGANDGIDEQMGDDGTEGSVVVHFKVSGTDITPPITKHHPEIDEPADPLPDDMSCEELAQAGQPQLFATNLMVGFWMAYHLWRYCTLPSAHASQIVETCCNSVSGDVAHYGLEERPL